MTLADHVQDHPLLEFLLTRGDSKFESMNGQVSLPWMGSMDFQDGILDNVGL